IFRHEEYSKRRPSAIFLKPEGWFAGIIHRRRRIPNCGINPAEGGRRAQRSQIMRQFSLALVVVGLSTSSLRAEPPQIRLLRVQQVGDNNYFQVRFDVPGDMHRAEILPGPYGEHERRQLALTPRLVPHDGVASAVYARMKLLHFKPQVEFQERETPPV